MEKIANIAKNTSYLTAAFIVQKVISFSYFIILARFLGAEALGQYYTAISFTTVFAIFIDLGFSSVLIREVAKEADKAQKWLQTVLAMKLFLGVASLALALIIAAISYDALLFSLILVSVFSMLLDSFTLTFFSVLRGFHTLKYESIAAIAFQLIVLIFGYAVLRLGWPLPFLLIAVLLASLFNFFYSASMMRSRLKLSLRPRFYPKLAKKIFSFSWPFALYNIFQRLFTYLDSLLLGFLASFTQVGLYQIAFKIILALQFLPMAFIASLYPALSAYWLHNKEQLEVTFQRALNYLLLISLPISFGVFSLADKIVPLFKVGDAAILPLQISIIALIFIFLNFPVGALLNACDRQRRNTLNMGIATLASVVLNIFLIPRYQAVGASITVLFANFLMFILGLFSLKGLIHYHPVRHLKILAKILLSSLLMAAVVFWGKHYLSVFPAVILGAVLYFAALLLSGALKKADIQSVMKSFHKS